MNQCLPHRRLIEILSKQFLREMEIIAMNKMIIKWMSYNKFKIELMNKGNKVVSKKYFSMVLPF